MLFNSIEFALFLPIVFILYWFVCHRNLKIQNTLLILASYVFYGWWDWTFLSLIVFSSMVDYYVGIGFSKTKKQRNRNILLIISVTVNLGLLFYFKYFNFFIESFTEAFTFFGHSISSQRLNIILPVGISFYTFQTLSYSIDVYKHKLEPTKNMGAFLAYVSFFPQLVAGPIERATNLLPQFYEKRKFEYAKAVDGIRQILWGLFKKIVIADNCAMHANDIFNNYQDYSGSTLIVGAVFFAFQIYGDFSGYSDIAIGTARLFGFNLMQNFAFPYFSRDIAEFWRRWHISLSTWFRDYLYIPLGGSKGSVAGKIRNVFIIFIVSGFWHGANWTYIIWGALNACYFLPLFLLNKNRENLVFTKNNIGLNYCIDLIKIVITFSLTTFAWIFFRADNLNHALNYIAQMFSSSIFKIPAVLPLELIGITFLFILVEWANKNKEHVLQNLQHKLSAPLRLLLYCLLIYSILILSEGDQEFIYFQF
jgi:alginate O-acetyltransferase complex protein AlgI